MTLREVYERIDALYPKKISDDYVKTYGGHDNSGILLNPEREIAGALFSLDLSLAAIEEAKKTGKNLIVTHHPAIFFPVSNILRSDPLGARLIACLEAGIGVISMHLNCDCARGGIDESLALALGAESVPAPQEALENGGYGRIFPVKEQTLSAFAEGAKRELGTSRAFVYGEGDRKIGRVASFCGSGVDGGAVARAKAQGADVIVSADIKHNYICDALEAGMCVVQLTHYASENYGFKKIYQSLEGKLGVPCAYHEDACML